MLMIMVLISPMSLMVVSIKGINMKKSIIAITLVSAFSLSQNAYAWGLSWESVSSWGDKKVEPVTYNVDVRGNNLRIYEWVTPTEPHQKCIFVASERNTNLQCLDVNIDDVQPQHMIEEIQ